KPLHPAAGDVRTPHPSELSREVKVYSILPLQTNGKIQAILDQKNVPLGPAMTPKQPDAYELPLMWQLYPGKKYRGSDSILWEIVYHIKFNGVEDMLLEQMESQEYHP
uniref:T-cell leukemia/lymphoma protein 1A n=1 Tax=Peromyscus maniculatus bairdii TaxID=230844 RepID=A0A8C8W5H5_PERMB